MINKESRGIVLYNRDYRESDKLVKVFTETDGKRMFFVKNARKSKLNSVIQPLTRANFLIKINPQGLSYIDDFREVNWPKQTSSDVFALAYATYIVALADAALPDNQTDHVLFTFLAKILSLIEEGWDYQALTLIVEIQLLHRFGVSLNFDECVFCHRRGLPNDFSFRYAGLLCPEHYDKDQHRLHLDPNVPYLLSRFQSLSLSDLNRLSIQPEMISKLRSFVDALYEEYVGIHLKSKKFIDDLTTWGDIMK